MNAPAGDLRSDSNGAVLWHTRRLWSLRDMMNLILSNFVLGRTFLWQEMQGANGKSYGDPRGKIPNSVLPTIERHVSFAIKECVFSLDLEKAMATAIRLENLFRNHDFQPVMWGELNEILKRLWDEIESGLESESFFHYSKSKAQKLLSIDQDWKNAIDAFPSAKPEILAGIDCYAIGHNAACVFYMCRVAEIGLRAIGAERGITKVRGNVPLDWGTWGQILDAVEPLAAQIRQKSNGPQKDAASAFYDGVVSDLRAILRLYRDPTMHLRTSYDDGETESAIFRARSLMTMLAKKLNEQSSGEIPWSAWP